EHAIYVQLLQIMNSASSHRAERISLSVKRMPRTLLALVMFSAIAILFLLFAFPFQNTLLGFISVAMTTALLFFAHFVLTDLDNPFDGTWNLSTVPFSELIGLR